MRGLGQESGKELTTDGGFARSYTVSLSDLPSAT